MQHNILNVIQEVLWSLRGYYSAIWSLPLTNTKWHSDPWQTVTSQPIRLSTNFITLIPSLRIMSGFHGTFATVVACQQGTVTHPDTWFRPLFGVLYVIWHRCYDLDTEHDFRWITRGFHGVFSTGVACQLGVLTLLVYELIGVSSPPRGFLQTYLIWKSII